MQKKQNISTCEQSTFLQAGNTPRIISIVGGGGKTHLAFWLANQFKGLGKAVCVTTTTRMYLPEKDQAEYVIPLCRFEQYDHHLSGTTTYIYKDLVDTQIAKVSGLNADEIRLLRESANYDIIIIEADGAKQKPIKAPEGHEPCIFEHSDWVIGITGAEALFSKADPENIHRWQRFSAITGCKPGMEIDETILNRLLTHPHGLFKGSPESARRVWVINKLDLAPDIDAFSELADRLLHQIEKLDSVWLLQLNESEPIEQILTK